jgi:hypothetical protein
MTILFRESGRLDAFRHTRYNISEFASLGVGAKIIQS